MLGGQHQVIALIVDNTDNFMSSTLEDEFGSIVNALNEPDVERLRADLAVHQPQPLAGDVG